MSSTLFDLALVISLAAVLGMVLRFFRQPVILAYIATGVIVGALGLITAGSSETFKTLSEIGIMLLLFTIGLEINYESLRTVGKHAVMLGLGQIAFTFIIGYGITRMFGIMPLAAAYVAIALTFSSTIIVVKLLSERKETNSLYGKMSLGFLLMQDFVAIILLLVLTGVKQGSAIAVAPFFIIALKGILLFAIMLWLGKKVLPKLFNTAARSPELLFVASLAWVFAVAAVVSKLGFNIEIAGFLAGVALANSAEHFQIASHIRPLRDFFILVFFVLLGASVSFVDIAGLAGPVIILSFFVLIGNPLIVLIMMGFMGYRRRTSFMTGVTMAQISEFSLILAALGLELGHITTRQVGLITIVGAVTIVCSSYLIIHGDRIAKKFWHILAIFERLHPRQEPLDGGNLRKPIVLIGASRTGQIIATHLPRQDVLVIDTDPDVVERLHARGYSVLLGDIEDHDIFESGHIASAWLVISTSPSLQDNLTLLSELHAVRGSHTVIVRAENDQEAAQLYNQGADYVIRPHLTSGHYVGEFIEELLKNGAARAKLQALKLKDFKIMHHAGRVS